MLLFSKWYFKWYWNLSAIISFTIVLESHHSLSVLTNYQDEAMYKLLSLLASNTLRSHSLHVKKNFQSCISLDSMVPHYAQCLLKLLDQRKPYHSRFNSDLLTQSKDDQLPKYKIIKRKGYSLLYGKQTNTQEAEHEHQSQEEQMRLMDHSIDYLRKHPLVNNKLSGGDFKTSSGLLEFLSNYIVDLSKYFLPNIYEQSRSSPRILSPTFMSNSEESEKEQVSILSPDIFSLDEENSSTQTNVSGNNHQLHKLTLYPLPNLLKSIPEDERKLWETFIRESTNVIKFGTIRSTWNYGLTKLLQESGLENETVKQSVRAIYDSFNKQQLMKLKTHGYAFLDRKQTEMIFATDFNQTGQSANEQLLQSVLKETILNMAKGQYGYTDSNNKHHVNESLHHRSKRVRAKGCFLRASHGSKLIGIELVVAYVILCPSAVGHFLLGSIILSPLILSPKVLFPFILSSLILSPAFIMPKALSPVILCAVVLSPAVLNPLVLSPVILTPFVLNPAILSPTALNPVILSPKIMSPGILTPKVLSPVILSPCAFCGHLGRVGNNLTGRRK